MFRTLSQESVRGYVTQMSPDWSKCSDVESVPGRLSGAWVVVGTRIPVAALLENADEGVDSEELTDLFEGLDLEQTRRILSFARMYEAHPV